MGKLAMESKLFARTILALAVLGMIVITPENARSEEKMPPSTMQRFARGMNPMTWTMPDFGALMPSQDQPKKTKPKKPSFFSQVSDSASGGWSKTKSFFNPKKLHPSRIFPASTRSNQVRSEPKEPGFWGSLFSSEPERQEISTVNDFLRQSRPAL